MSSNEDVSEEFNMEENQGEHLSTRVRQSLIIVLSVVVLCMIAAPLAAIKNKSRRRQQTTTPINTAVSSLDTTDLSVALDTESRIYQLIPTAPTTPSPSVAPVLDAVETNTPSAADTYAPSASFAPSLVPSDVFVFVEPSSCPILGQLYTESTCTAQDSGWIPVGESIVGEEAFDLSGFSIDVSCDGSIVAIGAGNNDGTNGDRSGHVRVYYWTEQQEWKQLGEDVDGEATKDQFGFSVSLSANGLVLAVGARFNDGNGNVENVGHVRVYEYDAEQDAWIQVGSDVDGEAAGDLSGRSVSLAADGRKLAIGAIFNDGTAGLNSGHVRVYELVNDDEWVQLGKDIDGEAAGDRSGISVSMSPDGSRVAVGAYHNDGVNGTMNNAGHVRIYEFDDFIEEWYQVGEDIDGNDEGEWTGFSVSMSNDGSRVAVGSPGDNEGSDFFLPGYSRVYELVNGNWTQLGSDLDGGYSVSLSLEGTRVAVGDYKGFQNGFNSGQAHVYEYDGSDWRQLRDEINNGKADDLSGTSVALTADGLRVAVSSPVLADGEREQIGATDVYDLC